MSEPGISYQVVTLSRIRLGTLSGQWTFDTIPQGAYALILRVTGDLPAPLIAAKVEDDGLLHTLNPNDRASRESGPVLELLAPESYRLAWTLDEERYAAALEDPRAFLERGVIIDVEQYGAAFGAGPLEKELEELDLAVDASLRLGASARHLVVHHMLHRHTFFEGRSRPLFDVTPPPIRALFTVEFMLSHMVRLHQRSANHLATFKHVEAMMHAADKGLADAALEQNARALFPSAAERRVFDYFRDYTWRCVATGIARELFASSIMMHTGPSDLPQAGLPKGGVVVHGQPSDAGVPQAAPEGDWLQAATDVRTLSSDEKNGPAVHPYFQGITGPSRGLVREGVTLKPAQQDLLIAYFDSYQFGAQLRGTQVDLTPGFRGPTHYRGRMAARMDDWNQKRELVLSHARALLEQHAPPHVFLEAVSSCFPGYDDLFDRYISAAAACGLAWWEALGRAERNAAPSQGRDGRMIGEEWPFWKTFKARTKPLSETLKGKGKHWKMLSERLAAYQLSMTEARSMLNTLGRLDVVLEGGEVNAAEPILRAENVRVALQGDGSSGQVRITLGERRTAGMPKDVKLRFVEKVHTTHPANVPDPPSVSALRKNTFATTVPRGPFEVEIPAELDALQNSKRYSKAFGALGDSVNMAIALTTLCDQAKAQDKAFATFDLAKGIVGVVEGFPSAALAMQPTLQTSPLLKGAQAAADRLKGLSTWLGRLDNVSKVYKAVKILASDETVVGYELRHARPFRAQMQQLSDVANVVLGAVAAAELAGLGLEIVGCSAVLLAGFATTPWGLLLYVGGALIAAGSALAFDLAQPFDRRLMAVEAALDTAVHEEVRDTRLRVSLDLDALLGAVDNGWFNGDDEETA